MALGKKKYAQVQKGGPVPHCPLHNVPVKMTMLMPGRRMFGQCPETDDVESVAGGDSPGHRLFRGQWVNR